MGFHDRTGSFIEPPFTFIVWHVLLAQVLPRPQLTFPSKTWFFGIYLNFQLEKSLENQYLPHSESKSYQTNSIKSCSSRSFQQQQLGFNLIFSEKIIQYSRIPTLQVQMPWNQADAPLLLESFPKRLRTWYEASWFRGSHQYKQTNYLPS